MRPAIHARMIGAVGSLVLAAGVFAIIAAPRDRSSSAPEQRMPPDLRRIAIASIGQDGGRVFRVLEEVRTTLHDRPGQELWAVLVRGRFDVYSPVVLRHGRPDQLHFTAPYGAAVITKAGEVVRTGLWGPAAHGNPVWERIFGEAYPVRD